MTSRAVVGQSEFQIPNHDALSARQDGFTGGSAVQIRRMKIWIFGLQNGLQVSSELAQAIFVCDWRIITWVAAP